MTTPALPAEARPVADPDDPRGGKIPGHAVRADGTVLFYCRHRKRWVPLKPKTGPGGFVKVRIRVDDRVRELGVALIVLRAFAGPRPTGMEPLHFPDPDPGNNCADNLRWSAVGSSKVGRMCGPTPPPATRGDAHPNAALAESDINPIRRLYRAGVGYKEIAEKYGVNNETIRLILTGKTWAHVPDPDGPLVMRRKGPSSESAALAKLDWGLVGEIRGHLQAGMTCRKVAGLYEMSIHTIKDISCGRIWRQDDR